MNILPVYGAAQLAKASMGAATAVASGFAEMLTGAIGPGGDAQTSNATAASAPPDVLPSGAAASNSLEKIKLEQLMLKITEQFRQRLGEALEKQGVEPGSEFQLEQGPLDSVEVAGQHPMKLSIEQAIASDPELGEMFRSLAELSERVQELGGKLPDGASLGAGGFSLGM